MLYVTLTRKCIEVFSLASSSRWNFFGFILYILREVTENFEQKTSKKVRIKPKV